MRKLLVIDKDKSLCEDVRNYLHGMGNAAMTASDFAAAVRLI